MAYEQHQYEYCLYFVVIVIIVVVYLINHSIHSLTHSLTRSFIPSLCTRSYPPHKYLTSFVYLRVLLGNSFLFLKSNKNFIKHFQLWLLSLLLLLLLLQFYIGNNSLQRQTNNKSFHVMLSFKLLWHIKHPGFNSSRGRVVKASDSKSDSLWERRFESYRLRKEFFSHILFLRFF